MSHEVCLICFTDGRGQYLRRTLESFTRMVKGPITCRFLHNDAGVEPYKQYLMQEWGKDFDVMFHHTNRMGFCWSVKDAWSKIPLKCDYVFHLEDDFVFNRELDLAEMIDVMEENPHLIQIALLRQPWNSDEQAAGGIWQQRPQDYTQKSKWFEHRIVFTTNPCLYRRSLTNRDWPLVEHCEGIFTHQLFNSDPELRSAFWGQMGDPPYVEHIGYGRVGTGY